MQEGNRYWTEYGFALAPGPMNGSTGGTERNLLRSSKDGRYTAQYRYGADGNLPGMGGVFNYVNLHAYHYAGNNPVKYTDPDGRDNEIYNLSGNYIRTIKGDTNNVYVQKPNIRHGYDLVQLVDVDVTEFNRVAALIYAEAASNLDTAEQKGMGEVVYNRAKDSGLSINEVLNHPRAGFDGLGTKDYDEALRALKSHKDPIGLGKASALRQAVEGTIDGLLGKGTIGAYYWSHRVNRPARYEKIKTINYCDFLNFRNNGKRTIDIRTIGCHDGSYVRR